MFGVHARERFSTTPLTQLLSRMGEVRVRQTDVHGTKNQTRDDCQVVALVEPDKQKTYGRKCRHAEQDRQTGEANVVEHVEEIVRGEYDKGATEARRLIAGGIGLAYLRLPSLERA
jgi:hypothetical protein